MPKYKHVIFDLDGTIMDTSSGVLMSIEKVMKQMHYKSLTSTIMKKFIGPPIEVSFKEIAGMDDNETAKAAALFRKLYAEEYLMNALIYNGISELLLDCAYRGVQCSIATYKRETYTHKLMSGFKLDSKFNRIYGSDDAGKLTKSDIIKLCINKSGISEPDTVMVGDTTSDAKSAKECNIDFIAVTYGFGFKPDQTINYPYVAVCNTANEIKDFLRK